MIPLDQVIGPLRRARSARWQPLSNASRLTFASAINAPLALGLLLVALLAVVLVVAERASFLSPSSLSGSFPGWMAGPLSGLLPWLPRDTVTEQFLVSALIGLMLVCYLVVLARVEQLRARWIVPGVIVAHLVLLLSPPLFSTDVFGYINYARLGVLHGANPYVVPPAAGPHGDPSYRLINWYHLTTPYGPLFTLATYPLAKLSVPVAFWTLKSIVVVADLGVLALVWRCASLLEVAPVRAVAFVGLNPLVLLWLVGANHNDSLMMLFVMLSVYLSLRSARADGNRWLAAASGAAIVVAAAIKAPAVVVIPAIIVAGMWRWKLVGMALAAAVIGAVSLAVLGPHVPALGTQNAFVVPQGLPNLLGLALGLGGETPGLHAALTAVALVTAGAAAVYVGWRRESWLLAAGCTILILVLTMSWAQAWYVAWLLPFAALANDRRLRIAAVALTALLFLEFMPAQSTILFRLRLRPGATAVGKTHQEAINRAFY